MRAVRMGAMIALAAVVMAVGGSAGGSVRAQQPVSAAVSPAADLRVQLAEMLTEHADVTLMTLEKRHDDAPDFPQISAALDQNTMMLADMVTEIYGSEVGDRFLQIWRGHIEDYYRYVDGGKSGDGALQQQARAGLAAYVENISSLFADVNPKLSIVDLQQDFQVHTDQTLEAVDAYASGNYVIVYTIADAAHKHIAMTGSMLAVAIAQQYPDRFPGDPVNAAVELRFTLSDLLTQHAGMAILGMQKVHQGAPDLPAAAAALDANTLQLTAAVGSVYGDAAAAQFLQLWRNHITFFVNYASATAAGNEPGRAQAQADLAGYTRDISNFLSSANPNLPREVVAEAFRMHVEQLSGSFDAYANGEFDLAYTLADEALKHMVVSGGLLANAIALQFPVTFGP